MNGLLTGLGSGAVLVLVIMWFGLIASTAILPFVLVSVAKSLRGIQRELEQLNGAPGPRQRALGERAKQYAESIPRADLGHQLLK